MPKYEAHTKSGAIYVIDTTEGYWSHANSDGVIDTRESLLVFKVNTVSVEPGEKVLPPWVPDNPDWVDATEPVIGKHMYLVGGPSGGVWRLSTAVEYLIES